jgi:hypothetical protein
LEEGVELNFSSRYQAFMEGTYGIQRFTKCLMDAAVTGKAKSA